jgi:hypothetical protein
VVTRLESTSASMIALWLVTGVFTTVITAGVLEQLAGKREAGLPFVGRVSLAISVAAVVLTVVLMLSGHEGRDPMEFSLMFTNGWVVLAFFVGSGLMGAVVRTLDPPSIAARP